jgi:hypothetical protein
MGSVVICMLAGSVVPMPGSLTKRCHSCRREVYVGTETLIQAGGDCVLACMECGMKMAAEDDEPAEIANPSPLVRSKLLESVRARGADASEEDIDRTVAGIARMLNARLRGGREPKPRPPPS